MFFFVYGRCVSAFRHSFTFTIHFLLRLLLLLKLCVVFLFLLALCHLSFWALCLYTWSGRLTHHQNHGQLNWSIMLLSFYWLAPPVSSIFKLIRDQNEHQRRRECDGETELICNQFSIASLFITNKLCFTFFVGKK